VTRLVCEKQAVFAHQRLRRRETKGGGNRENCDGNQRASGMAFFIRMVGLANFLKMEFACSSPTKRQAGLSRGRFQKRYG
jgi:hypothetical protein